MLQRNVPQRVVVYSAICARAALQSMLNSVATVMPVRLWCAGEGGWVVCPSWSHGDVKCLLPDSFQTTAGVAADCTVMIQRFEAISGHVRYVFDAPLDLQTTCSSLDCAAQQSSSPRNVPSDNMAEAAALWSTHANQTRSSCVSLSECHSVSVALRVETIRKTHPRHDHQTIQ